MKKEKFGLKPTYRAYIDEAGDEGFKFLDGERGSSRWFVLSALVVRAENDSRIIQAAKDARATLNKPPLFPLHFRNLRHEHRIVVSRIASEVPARAIHVLIHKPSIPDPETFQKHPFSLYRWASRILLERISWLCRDARRPAGANYLADLVFSNRAAMSYDDLRDYLAKLLAVGGNGFQNINIDWDCINLQLVRAVNHDQVAGLQIVDAIASGAYYAVNRNPYGDVETRYLELTRGLLYQHRGRLDGYGLKFWCSDQSEKKRVLAAAQPQDP